MSSSNTIQVEFPADLAGVLRYEARSFLEIAADLVEISIKRLHGGFTTVESDPAEDVADARRGVEDIAAWNDILDQLGWSDDDGTPRATLTAPARLVAKMVGGAIEGAAYGIENADDLRDALRTVNALERIAAQCEAVAA